MAKKWILRVLPEALCIYSIFFHVFNYNHCIHCCWWLYTLFFFSSFLTGGYPQLNRGSGSGSSLHLSSSHSNPNPPPEEALLKLRPQIPSNSIKLSYNGTGAQKNGNINNKSLKSSTASGLNEKSKPSDIFENRKRIASMLGRPSWDWEWYVVSLSEI